MLFKWRKASGWSPNLLHAHPQLLKAVVVELPQFQVGYDTGKVTSEQIIQNIKPIIRLHNSVGMHSGVKERERKLVRIEIIRTEETWKNENWDTGETEE